MIESKRHNILFAMVLSACVLVVAVSAGYAGRSKPEEEKRLLDRIKYPLGTGGFPRVELGGRLRARFEVWDDFVFGGGGAQSSDSFLLSRALAHADVHFGPRTRVYVEGKSSLSSDRDLAGGKRALDVDDLDLQQGFVELSSGETTSIPAVFRLRAGRQELKFGAQRLVSPLDWSNTRRTFEGFSGIMETENWKVTGFWTRFVPVRKHDFNRAVNELELWGLYAAGQAPFAGELDFYWLGTSDSSVTFNGTTGREERQTLGARMKDNIGDSNFDYEMESAYQFGDVGNSEVRAGMLTAEMGYLFEDAALSPRPHLGFDYASGDDTSGGDVGTFNQLYPLGHAYLGYIDTVGRQNIIDYRTGLSVKPAPRTEAAASLHLFRRADRDDALYNAGGGVVRAGSSGSDKDVGTELDLTVKHQLSKNANVLVGYSHFFTGEFIEESGSSHDIDFGYVAMEYSF